MHKDYSLEWLRLDSISLVARGKLFSYAIRKQCASWQIVLNGAPLARHFATADEAKSYCEYLLEMAGEAQ